MSATRKRPTPIERLMMAKDHCAALHGEAQWVNGYRAAAGPKEEERLRAKEAAYWRDVTKADAAFRRLAQRLLREASR
jgi:hypothetical protein